MRFYFEGEFNHEPREEGKLAKISIWPATNSRSCREIFILVAKEVETPISGQDYGLGLVGKNKTPMLFPSKGKKDDRILVMGDIPQPGHRRCGYLDEDKSTGKLIGRESQGGGAWGSGSCFLALLEPGQRMVSNELIVWENKDGVLVKTAFESLSEYELAYNEADVDMI